MRFLLLIALALVLTTPVLFAQNDPILQRFLPQAQTGNAQAQYTVGARYYQMHDLPNAKLWLQKSANQGNQQASGFLNMINGSSALPARPAGSPGATTGGAGVCPGTGRSLERSGISGALLQALQQMPAVVKPQLSMVLLVTQGVCQYTFVSASGQAMTFADIPGGLRSVGSRPASGAMKVALPADFSDLPAAIAAAQQQGMQLPLKSAMLAMAKPRGKTPLAVWTLQPQHDPSRRVESYFVAAANGDRALTLSDVSDVARNYNAQWQKIVDQFHAAAAAQQQAASSSAGACISYPGVPGTRPPYVGHWVNHGPAHSTGTINRDLFWRCDRF